MKQTHICPIERAGMLDISFRKLFQNPQKILKPFIKGGMTVLDIGCGPGFFTVEIAKMLNGLGKVIAADVQEGMLNIIRKKVKGTPLEQTVELHQSDFDRIGIVEKVDFVLAFWMIHEVRNHEKFFEELSSIVKPGGLFLVIEPKFHVTKKEFGTMVDKIKKYGFSIVENRNMVCHFFFSRAVVLTKNK